MVRRKRQEADPVPLTELLAEGVSAPGVSARWLR